MNNQSSSKWKFHPVHFIFLAALPSIFPVERAQANPQGLTVTSGSAHSVQQGNTLQITTSRNAFLQWNSFNIAAGETTLFKQPSASSIVFNNIKNANPSAIFGSLEANGIVVLENQSGFYFGPNAFVKAAGLVVTTAAVNPSSSAGGAGWSFDGPPAAVPIINYGHLETASGGSLFLIARQIENQGTIEAPGGTAALVAGQEVLLSARPDGLSLSAPVKLPAGSVDNQGRIVADAGQVLLQAQTVNNEGVIQANSVREKNGVIELYASQDIQLSGSSLIEADGGADGTSAAGNIAIKSGGTFGDSAGSQITATGGVNGGNGGKVEVSAPNLLSLNSSIDASAQPGWSEGSFSMDPENIELGTFSSGSTSAGTSGGISATDGNPGTVDVDVGSAFKNISANILLQATGDITLDPGTDWNLSASTGKANGQLTLEAGGDITIAPGTNKKPPAMITDANDWSLTLEAGYNFAKGQGVVSGVGNVTINDGVEGEVGRIDLASGSITVVAGNNVTVGAGGIVTGIANGEVITGLGGNINIQAGGNVNCGQSTSGYFFTGTAPGYQVDPNLGGISTASGGNVNIQAGGSISAALTANFLNTTVPQSDYGSGAFGALPGNVTLTAGGTVIGHYVVADGTGKITAMNAGTVSQNIALSLIKGAWVVNAAQNIFLQEVRNPNGMFNYYEGGAGPDDLLYDYDPLASVTLDAGNGVTITGKSLPRVQPETLIFPPILTIMAGIGGITLDAGFNLFPSPEGTLDLITTSGGSLSTAKNTIDTICVSDSQSVTWQDSASFTPSDHGSIPLHLDDPNPVLLAISGSISDINLYSPKPADIYVAGNLTDSSTVIQNLRPSDQSIISVGGEILDHTSYVFLPLPQGVTPNFNALDQVALVDFIGPFGVQIPNPNVNSILEAQLTQFSYDASTRSLKYQGKMSSAAENAFLAMTTPFLPASIIQSIFTQSQAEASRSILAYEVAGPGTFQIQAASMDLGNGGGIVSAGIDGFQDLAALTARGADVDISVGGNLSMLASSIESEYGGDINITSGGTVDIGSLLVAPASGRPVGIITLGSGNISLIALGDVDVDGSRIAAYDGGNIFVESLQGNVNAGSGSGKAPKITKPYLDRAGKVQDIQDFIPGSGILASSFPDLVDGEAGQLGNITVETPEGNIVASKGGIVQLALSPVPNNAATINLDAGSKNSDGTVAFVGDVDAAGSGVVGGQVNISATGNINGLVVASLGANVSALQNVSATVLSQGGATVSAGGTVSGTIVGVGSVSVSGGAGDTAMALGGGGVTTSGATSGAAVAAAPTGSNSGSAAATQQQSTQATQSNSEMASNGTESDDEKKKRALNSKLKEYIGRVTVILPE